jgi:hypothetical protein
MMCREAINFNLNVRQSCLTAETFHYEQKINKAIPTTGREDP